MIEYIKQKYLLYKEPINYLIFGILSTVVNLSVKYMLLFTILNPKNNLQLQIAVVISWILAVIFAYFTNRKYVFESKNENKIKEFLNFVIARIATLFIEMFIMWFFVTLLKLNTNIWIIFFTLISQIVVVVSNYIFSKLFIFKKSKVTTC